MHLVNLIICFIALFAATITDIKKREVPDWISYSLIAVALAVASAQSVIFENQSFILNSLAGLGVFFILANILYYGKLFAGGDAKLMIGIGAVLGIDSAFLINIIVLGGLYGICYSIALAFLNFKNFKKEIGKMKISLIYFIMPAVFLVGIGLVINSVMLYFIAALAIFAPLLYIFTLAVEKSALIKSVSPEKLTEGDWLNQDVKIKGKIIRSTFEGLSKSDIKLIKKAHKQVIIKYGLPFVPVFLIAFISEILFGNLFFLILGI